MEILPEISFNIVVGYIFISVFHFIALKQNSKDISHILTGSLVSGFLICTLMKFLPDVNPLLDAFGIMLTSVIISYFAGRIYLSKWFSEVCDKLKIRNSSLNNVWAELMPNDYPMKVICFKGAKRYEGYVQFIDSYIDNPKIVLVAYKVFNGDHLIESALNNSTDVLLIDTAKMDHIKVIYDEKSNMCVDIKRFCDYATESDKQEN